MSLKRYFASKDNTITNAFKPDLKTRGTGSNMGLSDILEVFSIYGQVSSSTSGYSTELSRILVEFPVADISSDRSLGKLPASGSVSFYLKMFNAEHGETLPKNFYLQTKAVTGSTDWEEGHGLDMESYSDSTRNGSGSNWINSKASTAWTTAGGDYSTDSSSSYQSYFDIGTENLEINITPLVEQWVAGSKANYGIGVMLSSSLEAEANSYYTKKFFGRGSEYFFKRPVIEARWNSNLKDNRGNFVFSSSLATANENLNTIYLYNYFRGSLRNIPAVGTGSIYVTLFAGDSAPSGSALTLVADGVNVLSSSATLVTGSYVSTGIYKARMALTASSVPLSTLYDVWHNGTLTTQYHTGSIKPSVLDTVVSAPSEKYVTNITNLKSIYSNEETARFRVFVRAKDWCPTIYTVATQTAETTQIESGSYKVFRIIDELDVITYGTGSDMHTYMSYDFAGNYFDIDMSMLEAGYSYGIKFVYYNHSIGDWTQQPEVFKFRVE